jgi:hypothetical protein
MSNRQEGSANYMSTLGQLNEQLGRAAKIIDNSDDRITSEILTSNR